MNTFKSIFAGVLLLATTALSAQGLKLAVLSTTQTFEQEFSLSKINVSYSRPSARGRKVFGEVVPFGKVWRTGANKATTIKFGEDVLIDGQALKAGEYSVHSIPELAEWTLIFNSNLTASSATYKQEEDVLRVKAKTAKTLAPVETFTIEFTDITTTSANLVFKWENTAVTLKIVTAVNQDAVIMASIDEAMKGEKKPYFQAASYYAQTKRDPKQALVWATEAYKADTNAFYMEHLKAKLQLELKDYAGALKSAEHSKAVAAKSKNDDYVKNNDALIAEIKKGKK